MTRFLVTRTLQMLLILIVFVTLLYFIIQAMPGDITLAFLNDPRIPPAARAAIRQQFGLDQPLLVQYLTYMKNFFTGNLGLSFSEYPRPVWGIVVERAPRTAFLFLVATLLAYYIGYLSGRVIAWRRGGSLDVAATGVGVLFYTVFYPLLGLVLIWVFGYALGWFPLGSFLTPRLWRGVTIGSNTIFTLLLLTMAAWTGLYYLAQQAVRRALHTPAARRLGSLAAAAVLIFVALVAWRLSGVGHLAWDIFWHMVLPVLALTLISYGGTMLLMRDSMMETIREDYVMAARAKGLPDRVVRDRYAARTAILPVMTNFVLSMGFVLGGGIVTETIFSWPGLGRTLFDAAIAQDLPLVTGSYAFLGIFVLLAHLLVDVLSAVLDPRIRIAGHEEQSA
ncbi:ABC transporter permease [Limnochorda pilosa]|uniref:ABC transporter permease n=1 Tax=Limnochorda pilosa TaxID=1555112 RepID=A0A0K2SIB0_LIMPI|nr:ABC transporter permease [Limnochorda pilosa]BAS26579.1 ABC transporter permease [Limnochorda pilosa]